jgi:non-ribosomal peptide synthetase component E (peptide arylation enzyme)
MVSQYGKKTDLQHFTLQRIIEESCQKNSPNIALTYTDEEPIRYSDLKRQIDHLSGFLKNQGVTYGDRVLL